MFLEMFPGHIFGLVHDKNPHKFFCREFRSLRPDTLTKARDAGYGVFFTPNGMGEVKNPKGTLYRWDGNITRLNACFADFDGGQKYDQMKRIDGCALKPSIIVESKRGYHAYWLLKDTEPTQANISLWRRVQTSIANKLGTDKACSNPSRLLRLPTSYHVKGEPFEVSVHSINNVAYTLSEMELEFPPPPRPIYASPRGERGRQVFVPPFQALHEGERHPALNKMAGKMYRGMPQHEFPVIREAIKTWYSLSCINLKPDWEKEVNGVCDWVEQKEASNPNL